MENVVKEERRKRVRRRRFLEDEVHHIYQRTINRFNIFYDLEDYLVYYTIFSIAARQYEVTVLGLCLMFDHIHMLLKTDARVRMSEFVRQVTCMFAREQNNDVGRKGSLFQARFGSAPKRGMKLLRTAIAYLFNNPVEKRLCDRAEEYRWNFLAYASSPHPYSDPMVIGEASRSLKRAVKEVDLAESEDRHLRYGQLKRLLSKLDEREKMQLVDHIISIYNFMNAEAYGYEVAAGSPLYFLRMGLLPNMDSTVEMHYYHPTFLYESLWNILGFVLLNLFYKKKRYNGQIVLLYGVWYGFGRMWIEGLRTDSLYLGDTMIRVSQLVAFLSFAASLALLIVMWVRRKRGVEFENLCSFCTKTKAIAVAGAGKTEGSNERTGEAEPTAPAGKETAERAEADTPPMGSEEKNEGVTENTEEQTEQTEKEQENG